MADRKTTTHLAKFSLCRLSLYRKKTKRFFEKANLVGRVNFRSFLIFVFPWIISTKSSRLCCRKFLFASRRGRLFSFRRWKEFDFFSFFFFFLIISRHSNSLEIAKWQRSDEYYQWDSALQAVDVWNVCHIWKLCGSYLTEIRWKYEIL